MYVLYLNNGNNRRRNDRSLREGKNINLALLLYPKNEASQTRTIFFEGLTVQLSAPNDTRLEHCLTLDEFNKAFRKYRNIICKVYRQRRDELDQYEADINDIATNYDLKFYRYHKICSAKAPNAIISFRGPILKCLGTCLLSFCFLNSVLNFAIDSIFRRDGFKLFH